MLSVNALTLSRNAYSPQTRFFIGAPTAADLHRRVRATDVCGGPPLESSVAPIPRIALSRHEAAAALGIGLDSFERYVQPHVRMIRWGRLRLLPIAELNRFVDQAAAPTLP